MLNPIHLETLQAVLRNGSLSAAGKELGYTTSAVSQHIKSLERSLGVTIFERGPSTLTATHAAQQLGEAAESILAHLQRVEHDLHRAFNTDRGRLRVSAFPSVAARLLPGFIGALVAEFPEAAIVVTENNDWRSAVEDVRAARTDLAFVYEYDVVPVTWPSGLSVHTVLDEEVVVLSGDAKAGLGDRLTLADLAAETWVSGRPDSAEHANLTHWCAQEGFAPRVRLHSNDFDVIRGFVREGLGLAFAPVLAFGTDRSIRMHRLVARQPRRKVHTVCRTADPNPLLAEAIRVIGEAVDGFRSWTATAFATDTTDDPLVVVPHGGRASSWAAKAMTR